MQCATADLTVLYFSFGQSYGTTIIYERIEIVLPPYSVKFCFYNHVSLDKQVSTHTEELNRMCYLFVVFLVIESFLASIVNEYIWKSKRKPVSSCYNCMLNAICEFSWIFCNLWTSHWYKPVH